MPANSSVAGILLATKPLIRRCSYRELSVVPQSRLSQPFQARPLSNASPRRDEDEQILASIPRWRGTPSKMRAPVRSRPTPLNNEFLVNEDPARLDRMYRRLLGDGGHRMLTDEVKWLAVTHKSFDHGRRGFNDRLALLGKRLVELQASLAIIHASPPLGMAPTADSYGRVPFHHPALEGLQNLTPEAKAALEEKGRIAQLAQHYGLDGVVRWKPKKADNLLGSGLEVVVGQALYAIIGAVALQRGGETANQVVQERILQPLLLS